MRSSAKPIHQCYTCMLNMGTECWEFECPRGEWSGRRCQGFENEKLYKQYEAWLEGPHVKTRKQLRQEAFRRKTTTASRAKSPKTSGKKSK